MTETTETRLVCIAADGCKNRLEFTSKITLTWAPAHGHVRRALEFAGNYLGWRKLPDGRIACPVHADGCLEAREL